MKLHPAQDLPPARQAPLCTRRHCFMAIRREVEDWHVVEGNGATVSMDDDTLHIRVSAPRGDGAYLVGYDQTAQAVTVSWGLVTQPNRQAFEPAVWDGSKIPWPRPVQTGDSPPIADVFIVLTFLPIPPPFAPDFVIAPRYLDTAEIVIRDGVERGSPALPSYAWEEGENPHHVATIYFPGTDPAIVTQVMSNHIHLAATGYPDLPNYEHEAG